MGLLHYNVKQMSLEGFIKIRSRVYPISHAVQCNSLHAQYLSYINLEAKMFTLNDKKAGAKRYI